MELNTASGKHTLPRINAHIHTHRSRSLSQPSHTASYTYTRHHTPQTHSATAQCRAHASPPVGLPQCTREAAATQRQCQLSTHCSHPTRAHAHTHTRTHTHMHAHTQTHTHTFTRTHTYTHTPCQLSTDCPRPSCSPPVRCWWPARYSGLTTVEWDSLLAETAAALTANHLDYALVRRPTHASAAPHRLTAQHLSF
jgi:hypothetical protein